MNVNHYRNQHGITLIELLATFSLIAIVIALSSSLIIQLLTNASGSSSRSTLQQSTNVLISELKNKYFIESKNKLEGSTITICFNQTEEIHSLSVASAGKNFSIRNNCIEAMPKQSNLPVTITSTNSLGQQLSIQTTFRSANSFQTDIMTRIIDFSNPDDFDKIIEDSNNFTKGSTQTTCTFYGNTSFEQVYIANNNSCKSPQIINGSAWFLNPISFGSNINFSIEDQLITDSSVYLESNTDLIVQNNTLIAGNTNLASNSRFLINNLYIKGNLSVDSNSLISSTGSVRIDGLIDIKNNNVIQVHSYLHVNGPFSIIDSTITAGKDAYFNETVTLDRDALLTIEGDAYFSRELRGRGSICIKGNAYHTSAVDERINIQENALQCN